MSAFGDDIAAQRRVYGAEYLGTTQIVTVKTRQGQIKARLPAHVAVRGRRKRRARASSRRSCRCSMPQRDAPCARPCTRSGGWLRSRSRRCHQAFRRRGGGARSVADIGEGEFVVLLGPTGAGKTTTLRLVAGLETPDAGRVCIGGRDVTPRAARDARRGLRVPAVLALSASHRSTTTSRFRCALRPGGCPRTKSTRTVQGVAELLHIEAKLQIRATQLSGGQMQRVAIGRALVRGPAIYLMDEPLSSLDAKLRAELRLELKRIQLDLGATILYVTHDQIEAMTMATRIGVLSEGPLVQTGTPREIYERPADTYVATQLGTPGINLMPARFSDARGARRRRDDRRTDRALAHPQGVERRGAAR